MVGSSIGEAQVAGCGDLEEHITHNIGKRQCDGASRLTGASRAAIYFSHRRAKNLQNERGTFRNCSGLSKSRRSHSIPSPFFRMAFRFLEVFRARENSPEPGCECLLTLTTCHNWQKGASSLPSHASIQPERELPFLRAS